MTRHQKMIQLKSHAVLKNLFKKLTKEEYAQVEQFVIENEKLDKNEYAKKTNRWMLDQPKPKHYNDMWAICLQSM